MSMNQLSMLLGLPDSDLKQILDYANTLSKAEAADHFKNLLGDSPQAIEFISAFNSRRKDPKPTPKPQAAPPPATPATSSQPSSDVDAVPKQRQPQPQPKKKKAPLHTPAPRQVADVNPGPGLVYNKAAREDDYMTAAHSGASTPSSRSNLPYRAPTPQNKQGRLVSDLLAPKQKPQKPKSNPPSRSSTPGPSSGSGSGSGSGKSNSNAPATKVSITGGTPMHGASGAIADLDAAIRSLEITANPSLSDDVAARRCNCVGARHPLQSTAPNCLRCGKVVCLKEGLGPCTFCGAPLLSPDDVQAMIRELKVERGRERQAADREAHRRPDVAAAPRPFTKARTGYEAETGDAATAEARAREHRDRLLGFQAQNARRTTVRDEAADFDVSGAAGAAGSMWASPEERARELKRQQKLLREMEWNARPDYEKRQQVVSIDLVGGKVVRKMVARERPPTPEEEEEEEEEEAGAVAGVLGETSANKGAGAGTGGAFSKNPLLGGSMIKPVYDAKGKGAALEGRRDRATRWRRVQDDLSNNEAVILDGGAYGSRDVATTGSSGDEPGRG